jgi:opacity protein-like surface antigen
MKKLVCTMFALVGLTLTASAQSHYSNAAFTGAYTHITGYQGMNGFDVGGEVIVQHPVSIAFDYDSAWNTSTIGIFQTTSAGLTSTHTHMQDFIVGPRIYFPRAFRNKANEKGPCGTSWGSLRSLMPFAEAQFGVSHINSTLSNVNSPSVSASDNAFTWELGGGADVRLNPRWAFRAKLDFLRTHFADTGQSHARVVLGVVYSLEPRKGW